MIWYFTYEKNLFQDYYGIITSLSKMQRHHPVGGVEQTNRICRIAVLPQPPRYGSIRQRTCEAHERVALP